MKPPSSLRGLASRVLYPNTTPAAQATRARADEGGPSNPAGPPDTDGGIYLGWGTAGPVNARAEHHALVVGPPRSGKTSRIVTPTVVRHQGPAVITSTKADILHATVASRSRLGVCWYWDPSGTTTLPDTLPGSVEAVSWSPVSGCDTWDETVTRCRTLARAARPDLRGVERHWVERAENLLAPLIHAAALSGSDMAVVLSWLHRRVLDHPLSILEARGAKRAADIIYGIAQTDPRELSGIFSTADSLLAAYRSDAALQATRRPSFDPEAFAESTDTLYLVAPALTQQLHAPIVVCLLEQIRTATYKHRPRPPMLFALDEVANIAPIPDLDSVLAEGGSQGLVVLACLQDLSQARARWDKAADGFLTLFTHKLVLPGIADTVTLKAISTLAGEIDVPVMSTNTTNTLIRHSTVTRSTRRQARLPADQIASGPPGTAILISGTNLARVAV